MRLPGRYDGVARPIVTYGSDPVLHRPCAPVTEFDRGLRHLLRCGHRWKTEVVPGMRTGG